MHRTIGLIVSVLLCALGNRGEGAETIETKLKKRQPNWRPITLSSYPNGGSRQVLFYAPDPDSDQDIPIKIIHYYPSGLAQYEADLTILSPEEKGERGTAVVPHGVAMWYYESGKIQKIAFLQKGQLQGTTRLFFDTGKVQEILSFDEGLVNGRQETYDAKGKLITVQNYREGQPEGEWIEYYPSGKTARKTLYENGVAHGKSIAWDEEGKEIERKEFFRGLQRTPPPRVVEIALLPEETEELPQGIVKTIFPDGQPKTEERYVNGRLEGMRLAWYPSGQKAFEGAYEKGLAVGKHRTLNESGELLVDAFYKKGKLEGPLLEWYENGQQKVEACYVQGNLEGSYRSWYPDGELFQEQTWSFGKGVGEHREYYSEKKGNHALYKKFLYDQKGQLDGEQISFYPNGNKQSIMQYDHGVLNGLKAFYSPEGIRISEAHYKEGGLEGDYYELTYNGTEIEAHYVNNRLEGPYVIYYPTKEDKRLKAYEGYYQKGKLEGEVNEYSETGQALSSSTFIEGERSGLFTLFDKEGRVFITAEFVKGNQHGLTTEYAPSGEVHRTVRFVNDEKEGEELTYHDNHKLASRSFYLHGLLDGLSQEWNKEGTLIFEAEYKEGKRNGKFNKYYDDGKPHILQEFADDVSVGKKQIF